METNMNAPAPFVIPDARSAIRNPGDRKTRRFRPLGFGFTLRVPRNDGALFVLALATLLTLSACSTLRPPPPLPTTGPIAYACANGARLMVDFEGDEARVAIVGGPSMVLPRTNAGTYSNGRYALHGQGASAQWQVGRAAPVGCRGS
jgi:hypothetical protein